MDILQFEDLLEAAYYVYGDFNHLFLDEPQNVEGWHLFVNRLLRQGIRIFVTGSNAKLLSGELATHLTGRYNQIELFPLSFPEYLELNGIKANAKFTKERAFRQKVFDNYLEKGGLPEIINLKTWKNYVSVLFQSILTRDIIQRFNIRNKQVLKDIAIYSVNNFGREINFRKIELLFGTISDTTIKSYFNYLEQAYLILSLNKFSFKSRERLGNRKYYIVDISFPTALNTLCGDNLGWKLENLVFLEILRRRFENQYDVHYFKKHYEIDFVISVGFKVIELIQVCTDISTKKAYNRETNALLNGAKELNCNKLTLITLYDSRIIESNELQIRCVTIFDWLCNL
jgi:predicted AAA+ superfamily ATPase